MKKTLLLAASMVLASAVAAPGTAHAANTVARKVVSVSVFNVDGSTQVNLDGDLVIPGSNPPATATGCSVKNAFRLTNAVAISNAQAALLSGKSITVDTTGSCTGGLDNVRAVAVLR